MTRTRKSFAKGLFALLAMCALATALTACGSKYELVVDSSSETGDVLITANGCKADGLTMTGCTVEEGTQVYVQSSLSEGTLHLIFSPAVEGEEDDVASVAQTDADKLAEEAILTYDATGTNAEAIDLQAGDYSLIVTGDDGAPATGSVAITMHKKD